MILHRTEACYGALLDAFKRERNLVDYIVVMDVGIIGPGPRS